ncbi:hypothetical protein A4D02_31810 [Niastella koreensis]|uniref:DUF7683 domain-containing protein n=2 Tax=Niastella koreensis TaxID=354356 RepID=G8T9T8_NIAKG|nr:hypothetical protein [Niastella koreensis]AEW01282.1 hypothetical protein Niako_5043 [Niastella koreensis GR20-10]OQP46384.1 hypothetical protein A4D02_31810 [Niastella koreensis]
MKNCKLIEVNRFIEINTMDTNEEVEAINIDHIPLEKLLEIFTPHEHGDPLLYDPYDIDEAQMNKLNTYLNEPVSFDNLKYDYTLAAFGTYEDTVTGKIIK